MLYSCFTHALLMLYENAVRMLYSCFTRALLVLYSCFITQYSCVTLLSCCGRQREGFAWQLAHTVGFTQALLRLYSGFTQALLRLCGRQGEGFAWQLAHSRLYAGLAQALRRLYSGFTMLCP